MPYRNLVIENATEISARNGQLIVVTDDRHSIPIEDINSILLENRFTTISTHALSELARENVTVYICDDKHLPCAVMYPFYQNVRCTEVMRLQMALTQPMKKRLWQQIVQAKIKNQAVCLDLNGYVADAHYLGKLVNEVQSGDGKNLEATAANFYFKKLFGKNFTREDDNIFNVVLNYGYTIMRGHVAKLLAVYGFIPVLGLHHDSTLNSFNLVDDFMEPLRPVVDLFAVQKIKDNDVMSTEIKRNLYNLLNVDMQQGEYKYTVAYAAEKMVQSFLKCLKDGKLKLSLPVLVPLHQHSYE